MTALVEAARSRVPEECQRRKCQATGCRLGLAGLSPERVLISLDCKALGMAPDQPKCDFLFVGEEAWIVVIELKGRKLQAAQVAPQLQAGARFAERLFATTDPAAPRVRFRAIAASKGMHPSQKRALQHPRHRIRFRTKPYDILTARCGSRLGEVLKLR